MIREELYNKTVDILVQAYFNDTLEHSDCHACAIGNIVAANMGYNISLCENKKRRRTEFAHWITKSGRKAEPEWNDVHCVMNGGTHQNFNPMGYIGKAKKQIDATGYSFEETSKIEYAFEMCDRGKNDDEYMFNGLMAVIEALDIIHQNTDTQITTQSKNKFNKQTLTVCQ